MKLKILAVSLFVSMILAACGGETAPEDSSLEENDSQNIKEMVHDYSVGNIKDKSASITSQQLIVAESDGSEKTYDLPEEEFFVSIAPYINETHP